ncbi:MAG: hypothetical protein BGN86_15455 [Caulobacterales bacterium 68-7]|nr:MAG: hypothetical protein BGN86_15455 [Caulobacterales bacterium 68-7]
MRAAAFAIAASLIALPFAAHAQAPAAPAAADPASLPGAAAASKFKTGQTSIGDILDNAAAKAVLQKHLPALVSNPDLDQGRFMTLKEVQQYAADMITDPVLAAIDADFAKLSG